MKLETLHNLFVGELIERPVWVIRYRPREPPAVPKTTIHDHPTE